MEKTPIDLASMPITGNFEINMAAPNGATLKMSGYAYGGEDSDSLNERMDVMREALLRQQSILEKPVLEHAMRGITEQLKHTRTAYAALLEKKRIKRTALASAEEQHLVNYPATIKNLEEKLAEGEAKLAEIQAK